MRTRPWKILDLLAMDEGKPFAADLDPDDPAVLQDLDDIRRLRAQLHALPDIDVDESVWLGTMRGRARPSAWLRFPMATAASVFFASVMGIYLLFGEPDPAMDEFGTTAEFAMASPLDNSGVVLTGLMRASRDLEQRLYGNNPLSHASDVQRGNEVPQPQASDLTQMLLFRLADVDGQIASLYDVPEMDVDRRQMLWQKRVDLLESLVAVRGGSDPAAYDNARSM